MNGHIYLLSMHNNILEPSVPRGHGKEIKIPGIEKEQNNFLSNENIYSKYNGTIILLYFKEHQINSHENHLITNEMW